MNTKKENLILCVDDDPTILSSLKAQLRVRYGEDYTIEVSESGKEALEVLQFLTQRGAKNIVVLTDWLMPGMKGDELLASIHRSYPQACNIMLSGQVNEEAVQRARREGGLQQLMEKPWKQEELFQCLDKATKQAVRM